MKLKECMVQKNDTLVTVLPSIEAAISIMDPFQWKGRDDIALAMLIAETENKFKPVMSL